MKTNEAKAMFEALKKFFENDMKKIKDYCIDQAAQAMLLYDNETVKLYKEIWNMAA